MNELWFEKHGFTASPFSVKTIHQSESLLGYNQEMQVVLSWVRNGKLVCIEGPYGQGKTTFVRQLFRYLGGRRKTVYFAANRLHKELDVDKLLYDRFGFIGRLFKIRSKGMICIIDEAHHLSKKDSSNLYAAYVKGYFSSIVLVTSDASLMDLPKKFGDGVFKNLVHLDGFSKEQAILIVRSRLQDQFPQLTDAVIGEIHSRSKGKPRSFLRLCDRVCKYIADNDVKRFTVKDLSKIV